MKYVTPLLPPAKDEARRKGDDWKTFWPIRESEELYGLSTDSGEVRKLEQIRPDVTGHFRVAVDMAV